ncbi:PREDICTED: uncharacterized protein LOC101308710 isoform X2 [Fragaria vesca subsp. vesca]|uniref:uncharacterized protein LOC101308710 isoform X2 n=1 Tax=Fragaria vesca subsp. vesca TaxID=101020 RepID=UPI0002C2E5D7|nr:PREDICTED: uncharacterized protein LOC101308710 isoform X2 [Fragaria vesca subsp. vesca]
MERGWRSNRLGDGSAPKSPRRNLSTLGGLRFAVLFLTVRNWSNFEGFPTGQKLVSSQVMDAYGRISREAALDKHRQVVGKGIEYVRSQPLSSIHVDVPPKDIITLVTEVEMNSGFLTFRQDLEDQVIRTTHNFSHVFKGHTLEKVDNRHDGGLFTFEENFYPILHRMLNTKQDWSSSLCFRGCATLEIGVMEWTEFILANFEGVLNQAGIFGAVGVSRYPYHYCTSTWKAFLELWSPLTNTLPLALGVGAVGVSSVTLALFLS